MDYLNDIISGVAVIVAAVAAWFARRAGRPSRQQEGERLAVTSVDYAKAHPAPGISEERTALDAYRLGDIQADGKRDFTDAQATVFIRAELARRLAKPT